MSDTPSAIPHGDKVKEYFHSAYKKYGNSAQGADWNSTQSQQQRFHELLKVVNIKPFTILDYGCGVGNLADYLVAHDYQFNHYYGYDVLDPLIEEAKKIHGIQSSLSFTSSFDEVPQVDFCIASGVFNAKLDVSNADWTTYVKETLAKINEKTTGGFAINFLTTYSDAEKMQDYLYYANPLELFDHAKKNYSKNVALLHDYTLYDFTLIVRK